MGDQSIGLRTLPWRLTRPIHCGGHYYPRVVLLAGRCQSAKWQVAVGYAWLADGTRENGGGRWFKRLFGYVGLSLPECFIFHTPRLRYRSDVMAGGKKLDGFVDRRFSRVEKKSEVIEHRELRYTICLSKYNAPDHVRKEALQRLATKRGVPSPTPIDELGAPSNPHVVDDNSEIRSASTENI